VNTGAKTQWYIRCRATGRYLSIGALSSRYHFWGMVTDREAAEGFDHRHHALDFARWLGLMGDWHVIDYAPAGPALGLPPLAQSREEVISDALAAERLRLAIRKRQEWDVRPHA
jgi:hypothetical protein